MRKKKHHQKPRHHFAHRRLVPAHGWDEFRVQNWPCKINFIRFHATLFTLEIRKNYRLPRPPFFCIISAVTSVLITRENRFNAIVVFPLAKGKRYRVCPKSVANIRNIPSKRSISVFLIQGYKGIYELIIISIPVKMTTNEATATDFINGNSSVTKFQKRYKID